MNRDCDVRVLLNLMQKTIDHWMGRNKALQKNLSFTKTQNSLIEWLLEKEHILFETLPPAGLGTGRLWQDKPRRETMKQSGFKNFVSR